MRFASISPVPAKKKTAAAENAPAPDSRPVQLPPVGHGRVFLIDAYSFVFRAYHAMSRQRPMSTRTGLPTAAIFVFVHMLNKLRKDFHPEYIAAIFDVGPSFREEKGAAMPALKKVDRETGEVTHVEYAGYKANRAEMPEDLRQQMPYIFRALEAYRIPIIGLEGFEADDLIGTLAVKAADAGYAAWVVSSDKDMLQLVNRNVCVLNPPKDNLICDAAKVEELVGVRPNQIVDLMALRGDAVDNVPGAPGIGDKGSVELIQQFGTLDALLERSAEVQKKSYRESLQENRERILLSRELVQIHTTAPVEFDPEAMRAREPDATAARELFGELEFNTLQREFTEAGSALGESSYQPLTAETLVELSNAPLVAIAVAAPEAAVLKGDAAEEEKEEDAEPAQMTLSSSAASPVDAASPQTAPAESSADIALSAEAATGCTASLSGPLADDLRALLSSATPPKAVHDVKSAAYALAASGIALGAVQHDTMLYAYLLDPTTNAQKLADVALRRLSLKLAGGVAEAADVTLRLAVELQKEVEADTELARLYREIDLPLAAVLRQMEETGVELDAKVLAEMSTRLASDMHRIEADIHRLAGTEFNVNSPKQLGDILFNKLALPRPTRGAKGKPTSTAQDVLEGLTDHEIVRLVLEFRQLSKLKSTYIDSLPLLARHGRLHTSFNQASTATGRLSSTNPNLQNIPIRTELGREIRAAFVAAPGKVLVGADYSQIELRLLAHYSQDPLLLEAYRTGKDIHTLTAAEVFGVPPMLIDAEHRRRAKAVNFGIVYGLSPFGLAQQIGIEQKEAKRFIDAYFARYSGVRTFIDRTLEQARRDGYVRNLFGRKRPIPDLDSKNPNLRGFAERTAVNTPLQGTAADLIKIAMLRLDAELRARKLEARMTLQVHDELLLEAPIAEADEVKALVKQCMEGACQLSVPMEVEVFSGPNWRDME